ncbi:MAG TPA: hypothetical protein ENJ18_10880 [Nannocystis exedens]|nr:hypothetical protein [Nannocystis exedens]
MQKPVAIVLAAGKGTRMGSDLAKVLHNVADEPMVVFPIRSALAAGVGDVVVVIGHQAARVQAAVAEAFPNVRFAEQRQQRGTGHAVLCALEAITGDSRQVLILSGDVPMLREQTVRELLAAATASSVGVALAVFEPTDPTGYGRILRQGGRVVGIREQSDATAAERALGECNAGVYCAELALLREILPKLGSDNAQGEIYLTDLIVQAALRGHVGVVAVSADEVAGINTPEQLAQVDDRMRKLNGGAEC